MEEKNIEIKFDARWFNNAKDISIYSNEIIQESMKYVANLNITEAKYKMEQIIDFNIPKKLKICTDEDGNAKTIQVNKYDPTLKTYEKLFDKFETYHNREHFIYRAKQHFAQFDYADEEKFDKLNSYLWEHIFLTADTTSAIREFKHWLINTKKAISLDLNNTTKYETIFGLYQASGGKGKSYLLESLCKAITIDEKLITFDARIFKFNSYLLENAIGVLYKDEIGDLVNHKDKLKELITTKTVTIEEKNKEPYFVPKTFGLLVSGNKRLGSYLFEDEGDGQRRNATIQAIGRLVDCEEQRDLIDYFKLMLKYCPLDEDTNEYVKNTSTTKKRSDYYWNMVKAIQEYPLFAKDKPVFESRSKLKNHIKANITIKNYNLPEYDGEFDQILNQILEDVDLFMVKTYTTSSAKRFKPKDKFFKLKFDENDFTVQNYDIDQLKNPVKKTYQQMVDEALGNNPSSPDPDKSSHKITLSVATERGINSKQLKKASGTVKELANWLKDVATDTKEKTDANLISNGYCDKEECARKEENFKEINSILLDCDNEQADKDLLTKFMHENIQLEKIVYQTASSTPEKPKFRVIIPLDEPISLTGNIKMRHIKKAVAEIFKKYTDPKASWFFTPTSNKIETIKYYSGQAYKSWNIISLANNYVGEDAINNSYFEVKSQYNNGNNSGWRNFKTVKDCFAGIVKGERDDKIYDACYAILKHFSKVEVREFLDQLFSEQPQLKKEFEAKFRNQYHC